MLTLYLQPQLLVALAERMEPTLDGAMMAHQVELHLAGFSAGSYTAIALEVDYRLLAQRLERPVAKGHHCRSVRMPSAAPACPALLIIRRVARALSLLEDPFVSSMSGRTNSAPGTLYPP